MTYLTKLKWIMYLFKENGGKKRREIAIRTSSNPIVCIRESYYMIMKYKMFQWGMKKIEKTKKMQWQWHRKVL